MSMIRWTGWMAPALLLAMAVSTSAGDFAPGCCGMTTRTYFGRPGNGPYGPPQGPPANPFTCKLFGFRCCKTPQTVQEDYLRRLAVAEARAQTIVNRVQPKHLCGNLATGCGQCGCAPECGPSNCWLFGKCNNAGGCGGGCCGNGGCGAGGYGAGAMLPGMNREDAVRYLEGMQYYPPTQLIRSPRDHFMFDTKYGIGR